MRSRLPARLFVLAAGLALAGVAPVPAGAQDAAPEPAESARTERVRVDADHVALDGYDPVSFFAEGGSAPRRGSAGTAVTHRGVVYRFASAENAKRFEGDPRRYEPLYGGWSASSMAQDRRVAPDPLVFSIVGGRLFVFEDSARRDDWLAHVDRDVKAANGFWKAYSGGEDESARLGGLARRVEKHALSKKHLAIEGYDPVAYFPEGGSKPVKGDAAREVTYRGAVYRFASDANRERFCTNPDRYEPAYGGWCAYAMADEDYTEVDPETFLIQDGRLLLFYNGIWGNTLESWKEEDPRKLTPRADAFWKKETGEGAPSGAR